MSQETNLLPRSIRNARARRVAIRWWSGVATVAIVVAGVWSLRATAAAGDGGRELSRLVRERTKSIETLRVQLGKTTADLALVQRELEVSQRIESRPDWSDLLALLDGLVGPQVVIESCRVSEAAPARATRPGSGGPPNAARAEATKDVAVETGYVLQISGAASEQRFISELVAAMEATGVFENITQQSRRRSLLSGEAVGFDLRAELAAMVEENP